MNEPDSSDLKSRRSIYLLPNLFTTASLFAGFYAIVAAMDGHFETAAIAVFVAIVLDGIDGRVARLTNTQSAFGAEYDSLSDMVSSGLAPALIMYEWSLSYMKPEGWILAKLGWLAAFYYAATTALRLARFNTQIGVADKRYFRGLPCPAAAALMMGMVWAVHDMGFEGADLRIPAFVITLFAGSLMVSNFAYYSFKDFDPRNRVSFITILAIVVAFMFTALDPPKVLFAVFVCYSLSGLVIGLVRWRRKRRHAGGEGE